MAQSAYRKASERTGWWLVICLIGVAGQAAILVFLSKTGLMNRLGIWTLIPGIAPCLIAFWIGWRVLARFKRQRLGQLSAVLARLGFQMTQKPDETAKNEFAAPLIRFFPTLQLRNGASGIEWFATQAAGPSKMLLFEHTAVTGSGKFTQVHNHTIAAWPSGHPDVGNVGLPAEKWFMIGRYPLLARRALQKNSLHNPAFADLSPCWVLYGDVATGSRFLTPPVRHELVEHAPEGEEWSVGSAWIFCSFKGTLDDKNLEPFLTHARTVLSKPVTALAV